MVEPGTQASGLRKMAFVFIAVFLIPLLFFVVLEFGLKALGVGTSFEYFREIDIAGVAHYQENPDFADQFYPPSLNIGPLENTFARERDPESIRVYVLGGSAALGFPHKNHGFDRLVAAQLRAALPARKVEVINTAMTSVNSHVVYEVARSIPRDSADIAVILMGNNEVVGPYGPGTFNQNFLANIGLIRGLQALKRTRIWQALSGLVAQVTPTDAKQELEWEGMQMFTSHGVPHDDPRMASVYSHYENNLVDTIAALQKKGLHVVLSTVPVNLRHSAPFLSLHREGLSESQLEQWRELNGNALQSFDNRDWAEAIAGFRAALEIDPGYADTHFRIATAFEQVEQHDEAKAHYARALDLDALRFRADTKINQVIRAVAAGDTHGMLSFVDSAAAFERASRPFQPGWNLLLEHVHYDFSGNHIIAAEVSRSILDHLDAAGDFQPLRQDVVASRVGFPNYDTIEEIKNLQGMIQHPPFPGQSNYTELQNFLHARLESVVDQIGPQTTVVQRRSDVVEAGLADWKVHFELAVLNGRLRNRQAMYRHLHRILELYPHNRETYMKLAEAMSREGKWHEVIPYLERSLYYTRGDEEAIAETINWLGTAYLRTGDEDKATDLLLQIPREYPDQIDLSLKAYGNLIRYSREQRNVRHLERYLRDVERYARSLIRKGKDKDYPLLYKRMGQIMALGGKTAEAKEWSERQIRP